MSKPTLVYIMAASHSGSTLTAMLLNAHPEICTAGELKATNIGNADTYLCSCQAPIGKCQFWAAVKNEMRAAGYDYDVNRAGTSLKETGSAWIRRLLQPLHRGGGVEFLRDALLNVTPAWHRHFANWRARNYALVCAISKVADVKFVADSSKIGIRFKYLRKIDGINLRVVRVIRDGRGVALTYMRPGDFADATDPKLRGGGLGKQTHAQLTMREAATEWRRSNEEAEAALQTFPQNHQFRVRYEDLCTDPAGALHSIHRFLELPENDAYLNFRDAPHHVVGNGMRLDSSSEIRLDDRWRSTLTTSDLKDFDTIAGDLNRRYGYL